MSYYRGHECPWCEYPIEIDEHLHYGVIHCPECQEPSVLDVDAEFCDGSWHDLSKLIKANMGGFPQRG